MWSDTENNWVNVGNIQGPKGEKGDTGNGIVDIKKTSTSGLIDTYTITYTNGTTSTFTVNNGASATHSWNGTTLTVTSESGTSSADLKGETGDVGPQGEQGIQGEAGKTAYQYAQEGGYTGTETEFAEKLASNSGYSYPCVLDYGAKGDGSTDDTQAFQNALATNRVVFVPGGTYILNDTLIIGANCCLELSQDTVLKFTQTNKNGISMLRLANLKGNHATIFVPYNFNANVINCDGGDDYAQLDPNNINNSNAIAVPPFKKWDPQWKMSRYVTDINVCKPNSSGFHYSDDGICYGTAVYIHNNIDDYPVSYMWGVSMSGVRIAGGFNYGIRIHNIGEHEKCWNHDSRIEAVIDSCKIGVSVENAYYNRLAVTIQPRKAADGTAYAEHGIKIIDSQGIDLSSSRVWDWTTKDSNSKTINSKWEPGNEYQHIAMYGNCTGLILDDFIYYAQSTYDIRELIYTDMPSNLEKMTILQEPIDRWFKVKEDGAYFSDGVNEKKLMSQADMSSYFDTDIVKGFEDILPQAIDTDGSVFNGIGYANGSIETNGAFSSNDYYMATGFIACKKGTKIYVSGLSFEHDNGSRIVLYKSDFTKIMHVNRSNIISNGMLEYISYEETENGFVITISNSESVNGVAYIRMCFHNSGWSKYPMVSIDNPIEYTVEGFLADGVKVKAENVVDMPAGGAGTPGKSAYEYAQEGGYTGTEEEFSKKLAEEIPNALPNPNALTINGISYDGSEAIDVTITGGEASSDTSLG